MFLSTYLWQHANTKLAASKQGEVAIKSIVTAGTNRLARCSCLCVAFVMP
jgi:hypothetical protein